MSEFVLDASALLALFQAEPGSDRIAEILEKAVISAVNLAEVVAKLQDAGMPDHRIRANIADLNLPVAVFDDGAAIESGLLRAATRSAGLSLGDRSCLELAISLGATAVTTDRAWQRLTPGIAIEFARS